MSKNSIIGGYIQQCNKVLEENNNKEAEKLINEIIAVFGSEIPDITNNLDCYGWSHADGSDYNYVGDINILKAKLINYKANLKSAFGNTSKSMPRNVFNINNSSSSSSNLTNEIHITYEQTIKDINSIPQNLLTDEDKQELEDKLASLQVSLDSKDKKKIGEKLLNVLKFSISKGPEVIIVISKFINFVSEKIAPLFK